MESRALCFVALLAVLCASPSSGSLVVSAMTWGFSGGGVAKAYSSMTSGLSALNGTVLGVMVVESSGIPSVSWGSGPDMFGNVTLDAMVMDATTHDVGAVGALKGFRSPVSVALAVMQQTQHTILVGDDAKVFALAAGFEELGTNSPTSASQWEGWVASLQPNYFNNQTMAWNYMALAGFNVSDGGVPPESLDRGHDTVGAVSLDENGQLACAVSTTGMMWKIAGRVGDGAIVGAGCYCEAEVGCAAATGNGDTSMRWLPSFAAVMFMGQGYSPTAACQMALMPIFNHFGPSMDDSLVCLNAVGELGGATTRQDQSFQVMYQNSTAGVQSFNPAPLQ